MNPQAAAVVVGPAGRLVVRFGPWVVRTNVDNVTGATVTGPYKRWKVVGPARLSFVHRGLTFATSTGPGLCICFRTPVAGIGPVGLVRHRALTVTVDDVEGLRSILVGGSSR